MQPDVKPAPDGKLWRVLPGLQAISVRQVVRRLPVIERLIAILDRSEESGNDIGGEEDVEGLDRLNRVDTVAPGQPAERERQDGQRKRVQSSLWSMNCRGKRGRILLLCMSSRRMLELSALCCVIWRSHGGLQL
jgi:hypothetical protein